MRNTRPGSQVVWLELVGFVVIIALSWANELAGLPRLLLGGAQQTDWRESVVETLVVVVVAVPVVMFTRRIVSRLHYLEGFTCDRIFFREFNGKPGILRSVWKLNRK